MKYLYSLYVKKTKFAYITNAFFQAKINWILFTKGTLGDEALT